VNISQGRIYACYLLGLLLSSEDGGATYLLGIRLATCFHSGILLDLFDPEVGSDRYFPPKRRLTFNGLHVVISYLRNAGKFLPDYTTSNSIRC
jgi:hypothetical protein